MTFSRSFFRAAALCSMLSAITTLALIFLPQWYPPGEGLAARMARVESPVYQLRAWIYLAHPFLTLTAGLAIAVRVRATAPGAALLGGLGFVLWSFTEAFQQTWTLFAFDAWRRAYLAGDASVRAQLPVQVAVYDGLWNAMYVLLLIGFALANLLLGLALLRNHRFTRLIGLLLLAACALTLHNFSGEVGGPTLSGAPAMWVYALLQPAGRVLIGVWLWRASRETEPLP
jgi:hypothetical protein